MVYIKPDVVGSVSRGLVSREGPAIRNTITSEVNALFGTSSWGNGKSQLTFLGHIWVSWV